MKERETKEVLLPSGVMVEIYTYLTAREANSVKEAMYKVMKIDIATGQPVGSELTADFMLEQERKLIGALVKRIAGSSERILENALDLRNDDYQVIVKEVNAIYNSNLTPAK